MRSGARGAYFLMNGKRRSARCKLLQQWPCIRPVAETGSGIEGDVIIAAHSAGALMVANWALAPTRQIRGALLVTPSDVENPLPPGYPAYDDLKANGWMPIPREPLPFPSIVVASRNDPLAQFEKSAGLARAWGSDFYDAGEVGHLNPAAGFGHWPDARPLLEQLAAS